MDDIDLFFSNFDQENPDVNLYRFIKTRGAIDNTMSKGLTNIFTQAKIFI